MGSDSRGGGHRQRCRQWPKGQTEVGKHLPETRSDINNWASVVPESQLAAQRKAGYFLDLWHWRAHRSNPIGLIAQHPFAGLPHHAAAHGSGLARILRSRGRDI